MNFLISPPGQRPISQFRRVFSFPCIPHSAFPVSSAVKYFKLGVKPEDKRFKSLHNRLIPSFASDYKINLTKDQDERVLSIG